VYFQNDGTPGTPPANVQRGGHYTWAFLLRRPNAFSDSLVEMSIVVYRDRNTNDNISGETTYPVTAGTAGTNAVTIDWSATRVAPNVRVGRWILDVTPNNIADPTQNGAIPGYFYRVVNYADLGGQKTLLELETNIKGSTTAPIYQVQAVV